MSTKRQILLTGAQGFLGKHIQQSLRDAGFAFDTLGRSIKNSIVCDLSKTPPVFHQQFHAVVHAAGIAHFNPKNEKEEKAFFQVNVEGTRRILSALNELAQPPLCFIFISTVGVYGLQKGEYIDEVNPLNATDPYGQSKIEAENLIRTWCLKHNVAYFILRLPLISGLNAPGNLANMRKAIERGIYFRIGNGNARKSIVLADDVANFIPTLFDKRESGEYNLTDGVHPTFAQIEDKVAEQLNKKIRIQVPRFLIRVIVAIGRLIPNFPITISIYMKITSSLTFSDHKARISLGWNPKSFIETPIT